MKNSTWYGNELIIGDIVHGFKNGSSWEG